LKQIHTTVKGSIDKTLILAISTEAVTEQMLTKSITSMLVTCHQCC